ncbi:MAG: cytochrome c oxidase assembly factor Coa1 family protein [Chloroflexota bacterium]|jgi:hypothetical protein
MMKKAGTVLFSLLFTAGMGLFFIYIFMFSMHGTDEYDCVMAHVENAAVVRQYLGQPVEPGRFIFLSYWESQGSRVETAFSTAVSGPQGQGRVRAEIFRSAASSAMTIDLKVEGETVNVYAGEYQCQSGIGR